ncbi:hypothetical protein GCM10009823_32310 [Brevibacterium salitolerans]|uniref:Uncharacterized protein n=1 Tax=Brevibacterium salitolerans TaxID=1403566 RepID=A0ABN2X974_9MICO
MRQAWSMVVPERRLRYSGSERPAWRMNHTGVRETGWERAAETRVGCMGISLSDRTDTADRTRLRGIPDLARRKRSAHSSAESVPRPWKVRSR